MVFFFSWTDHHNRRCTLHGRILSLTQDTTHLHYKATWPAQTGGLPSPPQSRGSSPREKDNTEALLKQYFNLNLDLGSLYEHWSSVDPNFRKKAPTFTGVRILTQDAWEALIAFICSSNNNISRISQMVSTQEVSGRLSEPGANTWTGSQALQALWPFHRSCRRRGIS